MKKDILESSTWNNREVYAKLFAIRKQILALQKEVDTLLLDLLDSIDDDVV